MPTERHRYQITETDEVARALDAAALRWPGEPRSRLAVRAIVAGGNALAAASRTAQTQTALDRIIGSYDGVFSENYLEELRHDWPA